MKKGETFWVGMGKENIRGETYEGGREERRLIYSRLEVML
jgi:hypothetical protein